MIRELLTRDVAIIASSTDKSNAISNNWYSKVSYKELDIERFDDSIDQFRYFNSPDVMIHLAWGGLSNYKSAFHMETNLPSHYKFLSNLIRNGLGDLAVTGTCLEYGLQEGMLSEEMSSLPYVPYARAKDKLRKELELLQQQFEFSLKWIRLFYMYGRGQNQNSILDQLQKAIENGDTDFNMSGGEQVRDYLPVEQVASNIVDIALQNKFTGVINCASAKPITIKELVTNYLRQEGKKIKLNLGYYPYPDYEPMKFWGNASKLNLIKQSL